MLEMKVLAIGDPHGDLTKIKRIPLDDVDLILLTGDLGKADLARKRAFENIERKQEGLAELKEDAKYVKNVYTEIHNSTINILRHLVEYGPVYTLQGNVGIPTLSEISKKNKKHHLNIPSTKEEMKRIPNLCLVKNSVRTINGVRIGFLEYFTDTCWVKEFKPRDYAKGMKKAQKQTQKAKRVLSRIGQADILVCHQPPYGYLDKVSNKYGAPKVWWGKHAGSKAILNYVKEYRPRYVFCGHIHEGEGTKRIGRTEVYNLGVCGYKLIEI